MSAAIKRTSIESSAPKCKIASLVISGSSSCAKFLRAAALRVASLGDCGPEGFCTATLVTESATDLGEKLLTALPALGYRIRSLGRTQPSLEDVFLAATRRSWDARLPDQPVNGDRRPPLPKF